MMSFGRCSISDGTHTRIYEAKPGISQEWANILIDASNGPPLVDPSSPVAFDRVTGAVTGTLGDVASQAPGTATNTFHFALNDTILSDNRIPPWRMNREIARQRNALPVPPDLYGNPAANGEYEHFDRVALSPPVGATSVDVDLLYQSTSWEYIQFLYLANDGSVEELSDTGENLLEAWFEVGETTGEAPTRMAEPHVMASITHALPEPGLGAMLAAGLLALASFGRLRRASGDVGR